MATAREPRERHVGRASLLAWLPLGNTGKVSAVFTLREADGRTLWSPALAVGLPYVEEVRTVERVLAVSSGIRPWADDSFTVDPAELEQFLDQVCDRWTRTRHDLLHALLTPVSVISGALLLRAVGRLPDRLPAEVDAEARRLAPTMPD